MTSCPYSLHYVSGYILYYVIEHTYDLNKDGGECDLWWHAIISKGLCSSVGVFKRYFDGGGRLGISFHGGRLCSNMIYEQPFNMYVQYPYEQLMNNYSSCSSIILFTTITTPVLRSTSLSFNILVYRFPTNLSWFWTRG